MPSGAHAKPTHTLQLHEPVDLGRGYTLQVQDLIAATVEGPDTGAIVRVELLLQRDLYQLQGWVTEFTASDEPNPGVWLDHFRIRLIEVEDFYGDAQVALAVETVGDTLTSAAPERHRIARGQSFAPEDDNRIEFVGHSHKKTGPDEHSPLIVELDWHSPGQDPVRDYASVMPLAGDRTWTWRDLEFTLVDWDYDAWIEVDVRRFERRRIASPKG